MRAAPPMVGWAKNATSGYCRTSVCIVAQPAIIGAIITVSMPCVRATSIWRRIASRSPDRLGT